MSPPKVDRTRSPVLELLVPCCLVLLLVFGSFIRNRIWKSNLDLALDEAKKSPGKVRVLNNLGSAYIGAGIYDKALEAAERAIQIDPAYGEAYFTLGVVYEKMGELRKGIEQGEKALLLNPDLDMARFFLGKIYLQEGHYEKAGECFGVLLKMYPYFPEVHHLMGIVHASGRRFKQAISEFEQEIRINPSHTLAHLNLGQIYWFEYGNRAKALDHLKAVTSLDPMMPNRAQILRLIHVIEGTS